LKSDIACARRNVTKRRVPAVNAGIVATGGLSRWLAGTANTEMLKPAPDDYLQVWPVSRRVNSSRAPCDDQTLIEQIAA
jgi:putative SOS response-associated peptidase YedK